MKVVRLTQGFTAFVDDEDFELVSAFKWQVSKTPDGRTYAISTVYNPKKMTVRMHRLVLGFPKSLVDHINHNCLDNQKHNLRVCTPRQNSQNSIGRPAVRKSVFKGVSLHRGSNKWRPRLTFNGKSLSFGLYKTELEAAKAYDGMAKKLYGEFACTNL